MHALLVTYENDIPAVEAKGHPDNIGFAEWLKTLPGLVMKTWINDGKTFGGFYIFTDKASADAYVNGEMFQGAVPKDPANRNVQITHFEVFTELSGMTGSPSKPLGGT